MFIEIVNRPNQPIRTRYLGHVTGYKPIRDQYFLIRSSHTNFGVAPAQFAPDLCREVEDLKLAGSTNPYNFNFGSDEGKLAFCEHTSRLTPYLRPLLPHLTPYLTSHLTPPIIPHTAECCTAECCTNRSALHGSHPTPTPPLHHTSNSHTSHPTIVYTSHTSLLHLTPPMIPLPPSIPHTAECCTAGYYTNRSAPHSSRLTAGRVGFCIEIVNRPNQPIRTRYLGHVTGYKPIRDQYFLIRSVPD
eukprot:sb/3468903/